MAGARAELDRVRAALAQSEASAARYRDELQATKMSDKQQALSENVAVVQAHLDLNLDLNPTGVVGKVVL